MVNFNNHKTWIIIILTIHNYNEIIWIIMTLINNQQI